MAMLHSVGVDPDKLEEKLTGLLTLAGEVDQSATKASLSTEPGSCANYEISQGATAVSCGYTEEEMAATGIILKTLIVAMEKTFRTHMEKMIKRDKEMSIEIEEG